jgi:hypothetical protein
VIAVTIREILDCDWSPEVDNAWQALLTDLEHFARRSS